MPKSELPLADEPRPDRCETCRFWDIHDLDRCRRLPPAIDIGSVFANILNARDKLHSDGFEFDEEKNITYDTSGRDFGIPGEWPQTKPDDWCGEWQAKAAPRNPILDATVKSLGLCVRGRKAMNQLGIETVGQLCERASDDLLNCRNFGMTALLEVREKLAAHGLRLKGE